MHNSYTDLHSGHCHDVSGLISAIGVTDSKSRQYVPEKEFFACGL